LGKGDADFGKKGSLKTGKGKVKKKPFENGRVDEAEKGPLGPMTRHNKQVHLPYKAQPS